jgi:hypothetical protein
MAEHPRRRVPRGGTSAAGASAAAPGKYVVYVHGICRHDAGFSEPWWEALRAYTPDIPEANRLEVLWSDVVVPAGAIAGSRAATGLAGMLAAGGDGGVAGEVTADLRDVLADRAQRQLLEASFAAGPATTTAAAPGPVLSLEMVGPQAVAAIPQVECVADFTRYLTDDGIREQVIGRFLEVVRPPLAAGASLEVISHSWGTVVAYEGLRRLDGEDVPGSVRTLFTVGSALSIPPVKRRLLPPFRDGRRPALAKRWVNLNARFDIVGGNLRGNPFAVDYEYLNLPPVGCSEIVPNPWCAHGSYFNRDNLAVNRDIFGRFIES